MTKVKNVIIGRFPLLLDPMTDERIEDIWYGRKETRSKDLTPKQVAESKLIRVDGKLVVPTQYLYSCLVEAGRDVELKPRKKISTIESTLLYSLMDIEGEFLPLTNGVDDQEPTWKTDKRLTRNKDKQGLPAFRPRFDHWSLAMVLNYDQVQVKDEKMRELFAAAGKIGIGPFRPQCRGPFGQFVVQSWEVRENGNS